MSAKPTAPPVAEDPIVAAVAKAPVGAPETEEERAAVAAARKQIADGATVTADDVSAKISAWRKRAEGA